MKRPIVLAFMVLCAIFWTVMAIAPAILTPKSHLEAVAHHQQAPTEETAAKLEASERSRKASRTNALGFMVVSWIGVVVLVMAQRPAKSEAKPA